VVTPAELHELNIEVTARDVHRLFSPVILMEMSKTTVKRLGFDGRDWIGFHGQDQAVPSPLILMCEDRVEVAAGARSKSIPVSCHKRSVLNYSLAREIELDISPLKVQGDTAHRQIKGVFHSNIFDVDSLPHR
jgi:hypothetical protein